MKTLMRLCASTGCALIMSAAGFAQHYTQTNLVSNTAGVAPVTDPQLINPWGLSRNSGSPWWVSDQATGFSTLYNGAGAKQSLIVTIPPADPTNKNTPTGTPTGTIANGSQTDFLLAPGKPAVFLFSTIDGTIAGWNPAVGLAQGSCAPQKPRQFVKWINAGSNSSNFLPFVKKPVPFCAKLKLSCLDFKSPGDATSTPCSSSGNCCGMDCNL